MDTPRLPLTPPYRGSYRLTGATLIDGNGGAPLTNAEVAVENDRIAYAGPLREGQAGDGPVIDLRGKTILPGFIDVHVHFALVVEDLRADHFRFDSEKSLRSAANAYKTLLAGVTTARDVGGLDAGLRDAITAGIVHGPRLHIAITVLSPTGGHADSHTANGCCADLHFPVNPVVDSDDELRQRVRLLMRSGADLIKICTSGGVSSPTDTPLDLGIPEHQIRLIREETERRENQPVAAHAQGRRGILEAIRGGVRSVEHGYQVDDEILALMKQQGTWLVPTLATALRMPPDPSKVPDYLYRKKLTWSAIAREHIAHALTSGVKVAMGTDSGICPHGRNLQELAHYVDLGMPPMAAIQAGTRNAAELMRLEQDLGTVEAGKLADLVIVDFDPLADIHPLAEPDNVKVVIQGGALVKDSSGWTGLPLSRAALA